MNTTCATRIDDELEHGLGYTTALSFSENEIQIILLFIRAQWLERIEKFAPEHLATFANIPIHRYHQFAHLLDHGMVWKKEARMLPKLAVAEIRKMSLIRQLESEYGPIEIVDEEKIGREEIDWRLVRPNEPNDIGPFHADAWFRALGHGANPGKNKKAIKVWVALCCEPGLNGLRVLPDSQKKEWRYHGEFRHSFVKPKIDEDIELHFPVLLNTKPGNAVIFHEKLLHAGALNRGQYTRISMEFMIFVNNQPGGSC